MYNKQVWKDEIPDLARPILDGSGKQKTDPQTGRPLFELVQEGTRITSTRLNTMEGGIEAAHTLVEQLAKELGGNFVAVINGVMGLQCSAQGLTVTWTAGVAYVGGRRFEVSAGNMPLNPTQGQYLYVDTDGIVKRQHLRQQPKQGVAFYVATDSSGVISSTDQRVNISLEEILMKLENIDVPEASLTEKVSCSSPMLRTARGRMWPQPRRQSRMHTIGEVQELTLQLRHKRGRMRLLRKPMTVKVRSAPRSLAKKDC